MIFQYGEKEINYLKKKDKKLGTAIDRIGIIEREVNPDPFSSLVDSVVSQQISGKAAATVLERIAAKWDIKDPKSLFDAPVEEIQKCGLSMRKSQYIKNIAEAAVNGEVHFSSFAQMSDDEIIKDLIKIKGVGVWTAEMILIFSLQRPDVISYGDLAIRRGIMNLYGLEEITREKFLVYKKRYSPYNSVASLYFGALS